MIVELIPPTAHLALLGDDPWIRGGELALAMVLSALIGLEREFRQKSAGLRTHTLVGVGSALFMLISKFAFDDVIVPDHVMLDPSRVASQIVSGVGFLGAGLIFIKRDSVHGLTTAAGIWLTAAIGSAAGAGLVMLSCLATLIYFVAAFVLLPLARVIPGSGPSEAVLHVHYPEGSGVLREILGVVASHGFVVARIATLRASGDGIGAESAEVSETGPGVWRHVEVALTLRGKGSVPDLVASISDVTKVRYVGTAEAEAVDE